MTDSRPSERRYRRVALAMPIAALLILVAAAATGYRPLNDQWIRARLPEPLLSHGPFGLFWWQWLALPALALLAFVLGRLFGVVSQMILRAVFRRTQSIWDDRLLIEVAPALSVVWSVLVAEALLPVLALPPSAHASLRIDPARRPGRRRDLGDVELGLRGITAAPGASVGGPPSVGPLAARDRWGAGESVDRCDGRLPGGRGVRLSAEHGARGSWHRRHCRRPGRAEDDRESLRLAVARRRPAVSRGGSCDC